MIKKPIKKHALLFEVAHKIAQELKAHDIWQFFASPSVNDRNDAADSGWQVKLQAAGLKERKRLEQQKWQELEPMVLKLTGENRDHALEQAVARTGSVDAGIGVWEKATEFLAALNSLSAIYKIKPGSKWKFDVGSGLFAIFEKGSIRFIHKTFLFHSDELAGIGNIKNELERILKKD